MEPSQFRAGDEVIITSEVGNPTATYAFMRDIRTAVVLRANHNPQEVPVDHLKLSQRYPLKPTEDVRKAPEAVPEAPARRTQIGGDHYAKHAIQPVDVIKDYRLGFHRGNAVKYILRCLEKGGKQDIAKARHILDMIIEDYDELVAKGIL